MFSRNLTDNIQRLSDKLEPSNKNKEDNTGNPVPREKGEAVDLVVEVPIQGKEDSTLQTNDINSENADNSATEGNSIARSDNESDDLRSLINRQKRRIQEVLNVPVEIK